MQQKLHPQTRLNIRLNLLFSSLIFFFGTSSVAVTAFSKIEENFFFEFRYMTLNGTVFTTLISLITMIISLSEIKTDRERQTKTLYYFRLSSAVTETIIAVVIGMSFLPFVPDNPNILSYDSFCMHVIIPLLSIVSFLISRSPKENLHPLQRLTCSWLITLYAVIVITMIIAGWIPQDKIPYSFLNIYTQPVWTLVYFGAFIYSFAYLLSVFFTEWNRKLVSRGRHKQTPVSSN